MYSLMLWVVHPTLMKKNWNLHQNWSINRDAMLVRTAPFELTARRIGARQKKNKHHIFAPTAGARCSISPNFARW